MMTTPNTVEILDETCALSPDALVLTPSLGH